jgi:hypothetical protein
LGLPSASGEDQSLHFQFKPRSLIATAFDSAGDCVIASLAQDDLIGKLLERAFGEP